MEKVKPELIDELLKGYEKPEDIIGENGLLKRLTKALLERAMNAELTNHLGYEKHDPAGNNSGNSRNGVTSKTVKGEFGEMVVETPRDRNGSFEPQILSKHQTRFDGFDDKILSMYARGMSTREIQGHLQEMYGVEVSPSLISDVTDAVIEEVKAWQNRPLEPIYGVVYLDALYVKMRHEGRVENRAVYVAIGVTHHIRPERLEYPIAAPYHRQIVGQHTYRQERKAGPHLRRGQPMIILNQGLQLRQRFADQKTAGTCPPAISP